MAAPLSERPRRILSIKDGEPRPIDGETLFDSSQSGWPGFLLERHHVVGGQASTTLFPMARVTMVTTGTIEMEYRTGLDHHHFIAGSGSVTIWPGDFEITSPKWAGECQLLTVELNPIGLERLVEEPVPLMAARLRPHVGIRDAQLASLMRVIETEARAGASAGPLYAQSLSIALATYLDGRYAHGSAAPKRQPGRLSRRQLSIVLEYIRTHLGNAISLEALAALVRLSPHHFSLLFRNAVGATPHQYVLGERVAEASRLLAAGSSPLVEIALNVGFANQSHFTKVFRRATGMTPRRYREVHRSSSLLAPSLRRTA